MNFPLLQVEVQIELTCTLTSLNGPHISFVFGHDSPLNQTQPFALTQVPACRYPVETRLKTPGALDNRVLLGKEEVSVNGTGLQAGQQYSFEIEAIANGKTYIYPAVIRIEEEKSSDDLAFVEEPQDIFVQLNSTSFVYLPKLKGNKDGFKLEMVVENSIFREVIKLIDAEKGLLCIST